MKASESRKFIASLKSRGWVEQNNVFLPPNKAIEKTLTSNIDKLSSEKLKCLKTSKIKSGWIDDFRNIRNKEKQKDVFMKLISQELGLEVWPEFYFSTERQFRFDYCIPILPCGKVVKCAIECDGGIWKKGNSGHSSGTGIKRDQEKSSLAASLGWRLIRRTPDEMLTNETLELIKKIINL